MLLSYLFIHLLLQKRRKSNIMSSKSKRRKLNQASGTLVDLTNLPADNEENTANGLWRSIGGVNLSDEDRYTLVHNYVIMHQLLFHSILLGNSKWLTDNIINATQLLLKRKYPVPGLQNTLLGSTLSFDVMTDEFVQVLHSSGNHWLTISTIGCKPSTVKVYDSLYSTLPTQTKDQICALLASKEPTIDLIHVNVQTQPNGSDCGLFTLAFATALCAGQDPQHLKFKRSMRTHLLKCLDNEDITPFPHQQANRTEDNTSDRIEIYYKCRTQEQGRMIACSRCAMKNVLEYTKKAWKPL